MPPETEQVCATALLTAFDSGALLPAPMQTLRDVDAGYRVAAHIARSRTARGEQIVGRKIGFTNRTIWPIYAVDAPVWGWVWDTSLHWIAKDGQITLPNLPEPRLEPEIVFGIAQTPSADMSPAQLLDCIAWIAHGVELVCSPFADWRFTAPLAAANQAMHGALWVGPKRAAQAFSAQDLEQFSLRLRGPDTDLSGHARDVLDGPLHAALHLIAETDRMPGATPLQPGEVITTGTLTDAVPIAKGQTWHTELDGIDLPGLSVTLV